MISAEHKENGGAPKPVVNGLVLAGGLSVRMGRDKGLINWHGREQRYYLADMLKNICEAVFISCRAEQQNGIDARYQTIPDRPGLSGPYGAILSAFEKCADRAWMVIACDLPLLDARTVELLMSGRDAGRIATAYESPVNGLPEPLIAIWEPRSYPVLLSFLSEGYTCPRKVLCNSDIRRLKPGNPDALRNINTAEEAAQVKRIIELKTASA